MFLWKIGENPNGLDGIVKFFIDEAMTEEGKVERIVEFSTDLAGVQISCNVPIDTPLDGVDPMLDIQVPDFALITDGNVCNITFTADARFGPDVKLITMVGTIGFSKEVSFGTLEFKPKP
jgi:hypothetical protein